MIDALVAAGALLAVPAALEPQEVLRRSDPGRFSSQSLRARLRLSRSEGGKGAHEIEIWRAGSERTLVRLLGAKEQGKYLLRRDGEIWLVSPRTKRPTRLSPAYRLYGGATLDEVLGRSHADAYDALGLTEEQGPEGALLVLSLRARDAREILARARLVVHRDELRPVRAEYWLKSGKAATTVEFLKWDGKRPRRLVVRDLLHVKADVIVDVVELEERAVPAALFDLEDGTARARFFGPGPASPKPPGGRPEGRGGLGQE
jgi:hypothetical protein